MLARLANVSSRLSLRYHAQQAKLSLFDSLTFIFDPSVTARSHPLLKYDITWPLFSCLWWTSHCRGSSPSHTGPTSRRRPSSSTKTTKTKMKCRKNAGQASGVVFARCCGKWSSACLSCEKKKGGAFLHFRWAQSTLETILIIHTCQFQQKLLI